MTPPIPQSDIPQAATLYLEAVAQGHVPLRGHVRTGHYSALSYVAKASGWGAQATRRRVLEAEAAGLLGGEAAPKAAPNPAQMAAPSFEVEALPSADMPIEELIASRVRSFARQQTAREARELIGVRVNIEGPYGVLHMGDPHLDDEGCDWATLQRHIDLANRTDGLFAANVGDFTNNWVGRLARLYANQSTTAADGIRLVEWLIRSTPWLYLVGGNHDAWSGASDPVRWLARQAGATHEAHGLRLALTQPDGSTVRINARHDFKGHSMWNGAHALTKAARFAWERDDIYVCGHRHSASYANLIFQNGKHVAHAIRLGAYKVYDDYADAAGFSPENMPAAVTVINPSPRTPAGRVSFFWDAEEGADYLRFLRRPKVRVKAVAA